MRLLPARLVDTTGVDVSMNEKHSRLGKVRIIAGLITINPNRTVTITYLLSGSTGYGVAGAVVVAGARMKLENRAWVWLGIWHEWMASMAGRVS